MLVTHHLLRETPPSRGLQRGLCQGCRADGWRRTKTLRARGGTLPQSKSPIRPECAREVSSDRTRRPGFSRFQFNRYRDLACRPGRSQPPDRSLFRRVF